MSIPHQSHLEASPQILVLNGVNLDLLGQRESQYYGSFTLQELELELLEVAPRIAAIVGFSGVRLTFFQTNQEAEFLQQLDQGWDGAVINAGAWTHTSLAIADRLRALSLPYVETHISNLAAREEFRQHSYLAPVAVGVVMGLGRYSYRAALYGLLCRLAAVD